VPATLVRGIVNLSPTMTWLEVIVWVAYVVPTLSLFFWVIRKRDSGSKIDAARESDRAAAPSLQDQ
jgi:high-affinity iron transporter